MSCQNDMLAESGSVEVDSYLELPGDELEEGQISKQEGESSDEGHTRF